MDIYLGLYGFVVGLILLFYPMVALGRIWLYTRRQTELFEAYSRKQILLLEEIRKDLKAGHSSQK